MGFEGFFKKKVKTEEEQAKDKADRKVAGTLGVAAVGAMGAAAIGEAAHQSDHALEGHNLMGTVGQASVEAPAPAENPTLGKRSTDAPPSVTISAASLDTIAHHVVTPEGGTPHVVTPEGNGDPVVINLAEQQQIVENPEH